MERFWRGEPKNDLFVAMPLHEKLKPRFLEIIEPAAKEIGLRACTSEERRTGDVMFSILGGIANSKMVLCDLSDDPGLDKKGYANGNVLFEAGIARTIREQHEVVLIREQSPSTIKNFDIKVSMINSPSPKEITEPWLAKLLKRNLKEINLAKTERIRVIADCLDDACFELIIKYGTLPEGKNNFYIPKKLIGELLAARRLIDLGILRFATAKEIRPREYSYRWTSLAKPLIAFLNLHESEKMAQTSSNRTES